MANNANILNEHFVSVMTADTSNPPAFDYHANHHMSDIRFSENDIANLLIKIKPHKAIGRIRSDYFQICPKKFFSHFYEV